MRFKLAFVAGAALVAALAPASGARAAPTVVPGHLNCATGALVCTEVQDPEEVFGEGNYVGHDEPSSLFYSNVPGSGNRMQYQLTLPTDPSPGPPLFRKSFSFQLHPAFWFGMAMCDTQSYPVQVSTCTPDSDSNIVDPAVSSKHPGTAFTELQFYPPGWVEWPGGSSCDPTRWCAALAIFSLSEDPVNGTLLNSACQAVVGIEPANFAFLTGSGRSFAPANPVESTPATFTPDPRKTFFMNPGDRLSVTLHDTEHGLLTEVRDLTTGADGSMVASAANGFGQVKYVPDPSTECTNIPYDFHPMYSTSSEQTRVIWAAHSYNIAFSDEIGHFDYCTGRMPIPPTDFGTACPAGDFEGRPGDREPTETGAATSDDTVCYPASRSSLVQVAGCQGTNAGFDGLTYLRDAWPDGNTQLHPTPFLFSSPQTGFRYDVGYQRAALEADLPRIEAADFGGSCDRSTGVGCTLIPTTDDGQPADFYPYYSIANSGGRCVWMLGDRIPGATNDFGKNAGYGQLLLSTYLVFGGGGATLQRYNNFHNTFAQNPCL